MSRISTALFQGMVIPGRRGATIGANEAAAAQAAGDDDICCIVKFRIWPDNNKGRSGTVDPGKCCLFIPHALVCR